MPLNIIDVPQTHSKYRVNNQVRISNLPRKENSHGTYRFFASRIIQYRRTAFCISRRLFIHDAYGEKRTR